ncbi:hypothetical protein BPNPMPFG_002412 [Mesorhizobium sp. AR07]|uniref:hypothetical protein n=1 Tax=Mesorhizobium sp. AR07 TaxID=2865838 RepID=UPI00215E060C|nr:hypothetical protein [Mesorhizobium sp. AR07]UVK46710.1 hypothetical protein BPNPMPFG_002412 [Mesorhizobium sp. AR07]
MAVTSNRYLVIFERDGEVIARETVTAPRELDARIEAAHRNREISLHDRAVKVRVTMI